MLILIQKAWQALYDMFGGKVYIIPNSMLNGFQK